MFAQIIAAVHSSVGSRNYDDARFSSKANNPVQPRASRMSAFGT
jgi:hypothetical protein